MYEIYGKDGQLMIETNDRTQALTHLNNFPDAAFVIETKVVTKIVAVKEDQSDAGRKT